MPVTRGLLGRHIAVGTLSVLLGGGCTSMQTVPVVAPGRPPATAPVEPGDHVRLTTRDGRTAEFTVAQADDSTITSRSGDRYATADIVTLERRTVSAAKTSVLILAVAGAAGLVYVILSALALGALAGGL